MANVQFFPNFSPISRGPRAGKVWFHSLQVPDLPRPAQQLVVPAWIFMGEKKARVAFNRVTPGKPRVAIIYIPKGCYNCILVMT